MRSTKAAVTTQSGKTQTGVQPTPIGIGADSFGRGFAARVLLAGAVVLCGTASAEPAPAVKTLPSGVQVKFLKTAEGKKPVASDSVLVHYEGRLTDGTVFDSSYKRGKPISFPLRGVIPCWTLGVAEMPVGSTVELTCPSETAYGKRGAGGVIPPDATLVFKVELLGIQ